jgi:methionine synthase II (cobalamin-independent)
MPKQSIKDMVKILGGTITGAVTLHAYYLQAKDISNTEVMDEVKEILNNSMTTRDEIIKSQQASIENLNNNIKNKNKLLELANDIRVPAEVKSDIYKHLKTEYNPNFDQSQSASAMSSALKDYQAIKADIKGSSDSLNNSNNLINNLKDND